VLSIPQRLNLECNVWRKTSKGFECYCWFHFAQADNKRKESGTDWCLYENKDSTQVVVLCLLELPLLPIHHTELAFQDVGATVGPHTPSLHQLQQLLCYVEKQWLQKATTGARQQSENERRDGEFPRGSSAACQGGPPKSVQIPGPPMQDDNRWLEGHGHG